jgi:hypothetical protein
MQREQVDRAVNLLSLHDDYLSISILHHTLVSRRWAAR